MTRRHDASNGPGRLWRAGAATAVTLLLIAGFYAVSLSASRAAGAGDASPIAAADTAVQDDAGAAGVGQSEAQPDAPVATDTPTPAPTATPAPTETPVPPTEASLSTEPSPPTPTATPLPPTATATPTRSALKSNTLLGAPSKQQQTLTLTVSPGAAAPGGSAIGQASFNVVSPLPSPQAVTYTIYQVDKPQNCNFGHQFKTVQVTSRSDGTIPDSGAVTLPSAGTYYWKADAAGDSNYNATNSTCQLGVTVVASGPTLTLPAFSPSSVPVGSSVSATATLSGGVGTPTGTVAYNVYAGNACTGAPATTSTKNLNPDGSTPASDAIPLTTVQTYAWQAVYSGDANNGSATSACQLLTVTQAATTLSLTFPANPVAAAPVAATATLGGGVNPTGTIAFTIHTDSGCTSAPTNPQNQVTVNGNTAYASSPITFDRAATVYWKASYGGDVNNAASSDCKPLAIGKAAPALALALTPSAIPARTSATGKATLSGATSLPTGQVTYTAFSDGACTATLTATNNPSTKTLDATTGAIPPSDAIAFNQAGTASWRAHYSGDANNAAADSPCVQLTVSPPSITLSLSTHDVSFGAFSPTGQNPGVAGVTATTNAGGADYVAAGAATVTVVSSSPGWTGTCWATENSGNSMRVAQGALAWQVSGGTSYTTFTTTAPGDSSCFPAATATQGGTTNLTYNYRLRVTWADSAGGFTSTITYDVTG